jgi:hypothetical protein
MFRITDGKPITLVAVMLGLLGAIFGIPIAFALYNFHMNHVYAATETLLPIVLMGVFALVVGAVGIGWYILGEYTYGQGTEYLDI